LKIDAHEAPTMPLALQRLHKVAICT